MSVVIIAKKETVISVIFGSIEKHDPCRTWVRVCVRGQIDTGSKAAEALDKRLTILKVKGGYMITFSLKRS